MVTEYPATFLLHPKVFCHLISFIIVPDTYTYSKLNKDFPPPHKLLQFIPAVTKEIYISKHPQFMATPVILLINSKMVFHLKLKKEKSSKTKH